MKPTSNATRDQFIAQVHAHQKSREYLNEANQNFTEREKAIFAMGFRDGVGAVISMTDSRDLNAATFRIVDLNGDMVPFYGNDRPEDDFSPQAQEDHPGLIVAIFPHS